MVFSVNPVVLSWLGSIPGQNYNKTDHPNTPPQTFLKLFYMAEQYTIILTTILTTILTINLNIILTINLTINININLILTLNPILDRLPY